MANTFLFNRKSVNWGGGIQALKVVIIAAILLSTSASMYSIRTASTSTARLQPLLAQMAADQPDQLVSVIVQKAAQDNRVEKAAVNLGGKVTKDLHIINAFVAEMTAQQVVQLAQSSDVRWISLDASIYKSDLTDNTFADFFGSVSYSNNNGTQAWSGAWTESGETTSPSAGYVMVVSGQLRMSYTNRTISRAANLSGATAARLTFTYRRAGFTLSTHKAVVQVSKDGGTTWTTLGTISGPGADANPVSASFDVTPWISANTKIRFGISAALTSYLYIDNVQITYRQPFVLPPLPPAGTVLPHNVKDDLYAPVILDFRHNSGTRNWTSPWLEMGESDGPTAGNIRLATSDYWDRILIQEQAGDGDGWTRVKGVGRATDLSTATTAVLSFVYKRVSLEGNDFVKLELTPDHGTTWYEVARFTAGSDSAFQSVNYNISPLISAGFGLRFVTDYEQTDGGDYFFIDDVNIAFDPQPLTAPPYTYLDTLNVRSVWNMGLKGTDVYVAVIDSGMAPDWDFQRLPGEPGMTSSRLHWQESFNDNTNLAYDTNGHGTHVAGIIGGSGQKSNGLYKGIAPNVGFISVKVSDDNGMSYESDVVAAMQWVYDNNQRVGTLTAITPYRIRVVNLSLNSTVEQSYHTSPLSAAAEILWFNGVVVVASAGNVTAETGYNTINTGPANDPFIITVGASDENGTAARSDDVVTNFSAHGVTLDGFQKPNIIAPGKNIVSTLAESSWWRNNYNDRFVDGIYFRASGTSMAAPMVTGAVALLLQDEPNLTPDQVKYRLTHTGTLIQGAPGDSISYPYLDVYAAVTGATTQSSNTGIAASQLLWTGSNPVTWGSVQWGSVQWGSVQWGSVQWGSVQWGSVQWGSDYWGP
ncbi:MAG: S8 family peptidase [Anaerolineae bacterium]